MPAVFLRMLTLQTIVKIILAKMLEQVRLNIRQQACCGTEPSKSSNHNKDDCGYGSWGRVSHCHCHCIFIQLTFIICWKNPINFNYRMFVTLNINNLSNSKCAGYVHILNSSTYILTILDKLLTSQDFTMIIFIVSVLRGINFSKYGVTVSHNILTMRQSGVNWPIIHCTLDTRTPHTP